MADEGQSYGAVVLLQPTSPLRRVSTLNGALERFEREAADSLLTVTEIHPFLWRLDPSAIPLYDLSHRPRRQEVAGADRIYEETGSVYVTRTDLLMSTGRRLGGRVALHPTEFVERLDIDSEADLRIADAVLSRQEI